MDPDRLSPAADACPVLCSAMLSGTAPLLEQSHRFAGETRMKIKLTSMLVDDQQKALDFYTEVLGFRKSQDTPVGEFRWIAVASPEGGDAELSLEPNVNPAARTFQEALFERDVAFSTRPTTAGDVMLAVFADTCGNLIQIYQPPSE